MSSRLPMVKEPRPDYGAPVPIEDVAEAVRAARDILMKDVDLPTVLANRATRRGREPDETAADRLLGLLLAAANSLKLDLVTLAEVRAGKK